MDAREGRIIMLGLVAGAAAGGLTVLLMRVRAGRPAGKAARALLDEINWRELFALGIAAVGIAKRIGGLSEPIADSSETAPAE